MDDFEDCDAIMMDVDPHPTLEDLMMNLSSLFILIRLNNFLSLAVLEVLENLIMDVFGSILLGNKSIFLILVVVGDL